VLFDDLSDDASWIMVTADYAGKAAGISCEPKIISHKRL
jgi:hypothetical protein